MIGVEKIRVCVWCDGEVGVSGEEIDRVDMEEVLVDR